MLRLLAVEPTVLFAGPPDALRQRVRVRVAHAGPPVDQAEVHFASEGSPPSIHPLGPIPPGEHGFDLDLPDLRQPVQVAVRLVSGGRVHDGRDLSWRPRKHWRVHLVPIAHHDLGYTDTIEGVLAKYRRIYQDVLSFCRRTAGWPEEARFRYTAEEAWSLSHFVDRSPPETVRELAGLVQEGRVEIPALFGNQISGLCGHEELVRLLYPAARLARLLGGRIRAGSITDVPGLSWGLPTVLAGAGVRYFFAGLPTYFRWPNPAVRPDIHTFWDEEAVLRPHGRPDAFHWQGPDGGRVLVYYQGGYGCWSPASADEALEQLPGMLDELDDQGSPFTVARYGGYGCGDNTDTDIAVSYLVREWNRRWAYPRLVVSTNTLFFEELEAEGGDLRTFTGELPDTDYVVGAASTVRETSLNRLTHDRLPAAERLVAATGARELAGGLRQAWDDLLLFDEHTWGRAYQVGPGQDFAWGEKAQYAYRAAARADAALGLALDRLAASVDLPGPDRYIVVYNPLSFERSDVVRLPGVDPAAPIAVLDVQSGTVVPHQFVRVDGPQAPVPYAAGRFARGGFATAEAWDLVFVAAGVPSVGYRTFRLLAAPGPTAAGAGVEVGDHTLENRFFRVELDPATGAVARIRDQELGRELVDASAAHRLNQLVVRQAATGALASPGQAVVVRGAAGPVSGSLRVRTGAPACPQVTQEITLYADLKRIDLASRVLKDSTPAVELYVAFPLDPGPVTWHFEGSHSVVRPPRDQFPGSNTNYYAVQHWAEAAVDGVGIVLAPIDAHLLEFGGLWPCYVSQAHHGVTPPEFGLPFAAADDLARGHAYSFALDSNFRTNFQPVQQGDLLFRYALGAHRGDWRSGYPARFGWGASNPLAAVLRQGPQAGARPPVASLCRLDADHALLTALKPAEEGDGLVVRLTEIGGRTGPVTVTLPGQRIRRAWLTDLVERELEPVRCDGGAVSVDLPAFGIATLRLELPPAGSGLRRDPPLAVR